LYPETERNLARRSFRWPKPHPGLPQPPSEGELSDADLATAAGGITPIVITIGATLFVAGSVMATYTVTSD
jgi:hypothetical protein